MKKSKKEPKRFPAYFRKIDEALNIDTSNKIYGRGVDMKQFITDVKHRINNVIGVKIKWKIQTEQTHL